MSLIPQIKTGRTKCKQRVASLSSFGYQPFLRDPFSPPIMLFIFMPVLYWLIHAESRPIFWDEYSHWGIYIREMASTHQLWTIETNAAHPDYPPGNALWQYFFTLIPGYNEGIVYLAQFVLLITPLLVIFENICRKQLLWIPAIMALLALGLSNFGHGITNNI